MRGALFNRRVNHAGYPEIEAEDRAAIELRWQINARKRFAQQLPLAFGFCFGFAGGVALAASSAFPGGYLRRAANYFKAG